MKEVCDLYQQASELYQQNIHLVSTDEMTGIQAIERVNPKQHKRPGKVERIEYEYVRHGTQTLIANWHVAKGQVIQATIGETRTEKDFVEHVRKTILTDPEACWIFILDQLNIHRSESLVRLVAELSSISEDLGEKGKRGILKSMSSRTKFLADANHSIRFVYVPKHTSWLNQIECWFSILMRRLIKRSSFNSTEHLKQKILDFIDYFNQYFSHPFVWKFKGFDEAGKTG